MLSLLSRVLVLVALSVIPALIAQGFTLVRSHRLEQAMTQEESLRLLGFMEADLVRVVEGAHQLLVAVSEATEVRSQDAGECSALLERISQRLPLGYELHATDLRGRIVCSSQPNAIGVESGDRYHVLQALAGQDFVVGEYVVRRTTGRPALTFGAPYRLPSGELGGAVAITMGVEGLGTELDRRLLPTGATYTLSDRNGTIIATSHPGLAVGGPLDPLRLGVSRSADRGAVRLTDANGGHRVLAYLPLGLRPSGLFLSISVEERSLSGLQQTISGGLLVLFLILIGALLVAALSYRHLVARPFAQIAGVVKRWTEGDYAVRAPIGGPPEIRNLGRFLNEAADAVAEREEVRREVNNVQRRMALVLASTSDGILELDRNLKVVFMNDHARRMVGTGDLTGRLLWDDSPAPFGGDLRLHCASVLETNRPVEFETFWRDEWYSVRIFVSAEGIALYVQNITRRKRAEGELRQSQELLSRVIELMPVGIWIMDAQGRISQGNPAGRRIWAGARYVDVSQFAEYKGWWRNTGKSIAPEEWAAARAITKGGISINEEIDIECFDGTRKTILNSALPILGNDGTICGAFIVNEDITDRVREQERLLVDKNLAEAANRAKSTFLAAASHDLRQPLQALALLFALLRPRLIERGGALADKIDETLEALAKLIGDVLDVSRLEAGAITPSICPVPVGPVLGRLAAEYRLRATEKGLRLNFVPTSLGVSSDPALIERIVRNLLDNAVKYTRKGRIVVGCRRRAGSVRIEVHDTGVGIPGEQLQAVFGEFHQLGQPGPDQAQGVGLGLWIVQSLARSLGHRVYVRSIVGRGSCFAIELPVAAADDGERRSAA